MRGVGMVLGLVGDGARWGRCNTVQHFDLDRERKRSTGFVFGYAGTRRSTGFVCSYAGSGRSKVEGHKVKSRKSKVETCRTTYSRLNHLNPLNLLNLLGTRWGRCNTMQHFDLDGEGKMTKVKGQKDVMTFYPSRFVVILIDFSA